MAQTQDQTRTDLPTEALGQRLPRGRHGLTREEVVSSQRTRMMVAMAEAMATKGYAATSVADILKGAKVSRETFYEQYSSKLGCFLATFDLVGQMLLGELTDNLSGEGTAMERFDNTLANYLATLAASPAYARVFLVEVYAAGPEAFDRRMEFQHQIVDVVTELLGLSPKDRFTSDMVVAGVAMMVTSPLMADDPEAILALHQPILELVARLVATT